jgi:hypothetical protein
MKAKPKVLDNGGTVTVRVPISIRKRGGRKLVLAPGGKALTAAPIHRRIDTAIVKAVARAFRWRELLEGGEYSAIREIAAAEKINDSYVSRVLRLTLLAPEIVESMLNGRLPSEVQLEDFMKRFPVDWSAQRDAFGFQ